MGWVTLISSSFKLSAEASNPPEARGEFELVLKSMGQGCERYRDQGFGPGLEERDAQGQARGPSSPTWGTAATRGSPSLWEQAPEGLFTAAQWA